MEWERNSKFTISMTSLGQEWVRLVCWEFCNAWIWKWKKINPGHEIWGSHSGAAGVLKLMIYDVSTYNSYQSVLHCLFAFIMLPRLLVCNLQVLTLRNSIETHKGGGPWGKNICMKQSSCREANSPSAGREISLILLEYISSLPSSQEPAACLCPKPD